MKEVKYINKQNNNMKVITVLKIILFLSLATITGVLNIFPVISTSCSSENSYRCDPSDINVIQKCIGGVWTGWQSCTFGCNPSTGGCYPANGCLLNDTYQCNPQISTVLQKCVNNLWINWQSCGYGCDYFNTVCGSPPTTTSVGTTSATTTIIGEISTTTTTTTIPLIGIQYFQTVLTDSQTYGSTKNGLWSTNKYVYVVNRDYGKINQFNKTTLSFIQSLTMFSSIEGGTWNGTHNFIVNDTTTPSSNIYIYDENFSTYYGYWNTSSFCPRPITDPMIGLAYDYKQNVIWANCISQYAIFKLSATNGTNLGNMTWDAWIGGYWLTDLDFDGNYLLIAQYYNPLRIYVINQTKALDEGAINQSDILASVTDYPSASITFANGMLIAGVSGGFYEYNYSLNSFICSPENTYQCDPTSNITLQKCVNNTWVGWSSCQYGCSGNNCNTPSVTNSTGFCFGEGAYSCNPYNPFDNTTLFKCVNNLWTGWQTCSHGCDFQTNRCSINETATTTVSGSNVPVFGFGSIFDSLGIGFASNFTTPFFLSTFIMIGIATVVSYYANGKNGINTPAFGIVCIVITMAYTYLGIYPIWIGIVLILLSGFVIAKFLTSMASGGG
jgi:hypothetical protein